nr:hypothetical protein [Tanacetum cinerariifolium]
MDTNSHEYATDPSCSKGMQQDATETLGSEDPLVGQTVTRSTRKSVLPSKYSDFVLNKDVNMIHEPTTYAEATKDNSWIDVMNQEIKALNINNPWVIVDLPANKKAIGSKWILKIKYKAGGDIEMFKARLAAKGFNQKGRNRLR